MKQHMCCAAAQQLPSHFTLTVLKHGLRLCRIVFSLFVVSLSTHIGTAAVLQRAMQPASVAGEGFCYAIPTMSQVLL
jgi:hypothetical protein